MKKMLKKNIFVLSLVLSPIFLFILIFMAVVAVFYMETTANMGDYQGAMDKKNENIEISIGSQDVEPEILSLRDKINKVAISYDIGIYTDLLLAICSFETENSNIYDNDIFNCASYLDIDDDSLDLDSSINNGVKYFAELLFLADVEGTEDIDGIKLAVQSYNFGVDFISFAVEYTGGWSVSAVDEYSKIQSNGITRDDKSQQDKGVWDFGDQNYCNHVLKYYNLTNNENSDKNENDRFKPDVMINYAKDFVGCTYELGACGPNNFDSSGFVYYIFSTSGFYKGSRFTVSELKNISSELSYDELVPGDLVFFNRVLVAYHVGIYIGDGQFIHASPDKGVSISNIAGLTVGQNCYVTYGRLN